MKLELRHTVKKEAEGTYYTVPFDVPENIEKITVSYTYFRGTKGLLGDLMPVNTIDIGLQDEKGRFLGWSGSAHSTISVGEYASSSGYLSEPIHAGQWQILVGAYHVREGGVEVLYTIEMEEKKPRWLFGDLHIHSDASDGRFDSFTLGKMAKERRLDFIALANHNNFAENYHLPHLDNLTFVRAVEWTHYKGHMNFFGLAEPFENSFIANSHEQMQKIIADARERGAVISVNHPKCRFCPYLWEDENAFDMMEIWNGPMRPTNIDGIAWWTELLRQGRKIPAVGGSDYHRPHSLAKLGEPVTAVFASSRSEADILAAIRSGHAYVTENRDGPVLSLRYGDAMMGDTVINKADTYLEIEAENLAGASLYLVTEKGEQLLCRGKKEHTERVKLNRPRFAYLKAVKGKKRVSAVSNPVYFEPTEVLS